MHTVFNIKKISDFYLTLIKLVDFFKVFQVFQDLQEPCVGKYLKIQNFYLKKKTTKKPRKTGHVATMHFFSIFKVCQNH